MSARVFVFGVDAMEPRLIRQWIESGDLPHLARLQARAVSGEVLNPPRFFSGATWPNFYTGVGPGRHGQYLRTAYDPKTGIATALRPRFDLMPPFWSRPQWHGRKKAIVNLPYCPFDANIDGIQVVGWRAHDGHVEHEAQVAPASVETEIATRFGYLDSGNCETLDFSTRALSALRRRLIDTVRQKAQVVCEQLVARPWDLFVSVIDESHCAGHRFWCLHDTQHPHHDPALVATLGNVLREVYVEIDRALGAVLDRLDSTATIIFLASHGMGPAFDGIAALDEILRRLDGLPARVADFSTQRSAWLRQARSVFDRLPRAARAALAPLPKRFGRHRLGRHLDEERQRRRYFWFPTHDQCGGIRINLAGREKDGGVGAGRDYEAVVGQLKRDLHDLRDGKTGEPVVAEVLRREEVDHTGYAGETPDLIVRWAQASLWWIESPRIGRIDPVLVRGRTGDHDPQMRGLFLASGPGIGHGATARPVRLEDFAPTISARMGLPLDDTEGELVSELCRATGPH